MFVIIGSVTADLFILSREPFAAAGSDGFRAGNLVFTEQPLKILMGGNGGNSAYVLAGLGAPTALGGMVGQDTLGDFLVEQLKARQVNLDGLQRNDTHATSTSTIIMTDAANQVVFHHLGGTSHTRFETLPESLFSRAEALLCASAPIMTGMRGDGFARALAATHRAGGITAMDIGPAIGEPLTVEELLPLFPQLDYLIGNTHELAVLAGMDDWETAASHLLAKGANAIVIKQGKRGASVRAEGIKLDVPGFAVEVHISAGAGDSFNVGFLYGMRQGWSLEKAVRFANAVAALVVSSRNGVLGSPTLDEVETFLAEQKTT